MYQTGQKVTIQWAGNDLPAEVLYPVAQRALAGEAQIRVRFEYKGRRFEETVVETAVSALKAYEWNAYELLRLFKDGGFEAQGVGRDKIQVSLDRPLNTSEVERFLDQHGVDQNGVSVTRGNGDTVVVQTKSLPIEEDEAGDLPHVHDKVVIVEGDLKGQHGEVIGHTVLHGDPVFNIRLADGSTELLREHEFDVKASATRGRIAPDYEIGDRVKNLDTGKVGVVREIEKHGTGGDQYWAFAVQWDGETLRNGSWVAEEDLQEAAEKAITCDDTDYKSTTGRRPYGVKTWRFQAGDHTKAWHGGYRSARAAAKKWARTIGASTIKLMVPETNSKALVGKPEDIAQQLLRFLCRRRQGS